MKTSVKILTLTALFGLCLVSCDNTTIKPPQEEETLAVREFALTYSAQWDYYSIPWNTTILNADTVFVINSQEEFDRYFPTAASGPDNFADYSLLFVYGTTTSQVANSSYNVVSETGGTYRLDVDIELGTALTPDVWCVSILVPKIPDVTIIPYRKTINGIEDGNDESQKEEEACRDNITGRWKLVADTVLIFKNDILYEIKHNNYSDNNIIYDFQEDNILVIEGTAATDYYAEGRHTYKYITGEFDGKLQIDDDDNIYCRALSNSEFMTIQTERETGQGTVSYIQSFIKTNIPDDDKNETFSDAALIDNQWEFLVKSSANDLTGNYEMDYSSSTISMTLLGGTKVNEILDGTLFVNTLSSVHHFTPEDAFLKLYHNEKDYLLFNRIPL